MDGGEGLPRLAATLWTTLLDVAPIAIVLFGFQALVLRERLPHLRRKLVGLVYVVVGLALFLVGLDQALFPIGRTMAQQLSSMTFVQGQGGGGGGTAVARWHDYGWLYVFAAAIGFATTIAEPALMAVALKAREVSGGALKPWGLRIAVASAWRRGWRWAASALLPAPPCRFTS